MMDHFSLLLLRGATAPDDGALAGGVSLWRVFGAWTLCIAIAVLLILALRRARAGRVNARIASFLPRGLGAAPRAIALVETRRANLSVDLCLFDYNGERYLVAIGPGGSTLLDRTPAPMSEAGDIAP